MISPEERRYLYWLGAQVWNGDGHIVEMGPWLGGSTVCLAAGMRDNPSHSGRKLHVFDNFVWRDFMAERARLPITSGESFQSFFERNLEAYKDLIVVHRSALSDGCVALDKWAKSVHADEGEKIPTLRWDCAEPVEILFIDGAKSWDGLIHLLRTFAPHLIAKESLLVCQDYKSWDSYWVPIVFEALMQHFELRHNLPYNTVTFKLTSALPIEAVEDLGRVEDFDTERGLDLLDTARRRLQDMKDPLGALTLQGSKARFLHHKGQTDSALESFRSLESAWPHNLDGLTIDRMRIWLEIETGRKFPPPLRWRYGSVIRKIARITARLAALRSQRAA